MQTSYSTDQGAVAYEGQLYDSGQTDKVSAKCANAIPYGKLLIKGAGDFEAGLPASALDVTNARRTLGISIATQAIEQSLTGDPQYPAKSVVSVLRKGRIWVKVEDTVTPNSDVFVRHAAGGNGVGSFAGAAGAGLALLAGAQYLTGASANGFAVLEVNFPATTFTPPA